MSSFTTPLVVEFLGNGWWRVAEEFDYYLDDYQTEVIRVPLGFQTNFANTPRILWPLLPPAGEYGKATVVHDYLYNLGGRMPDGKVYSRRAADGIFLEAMGVLGVGRWERWVMWLAVRAFGRGKF